MYMGNRNILLIILVVVIPIGVLGIARYETVREAKKAVNAKLTNGYGAHFKNIRLTAIGTICGEVNAKNNNGDYQGFRFFYVSNLTAKQTVWIDSDSVHLARKICNSE